MSRCIYCLEEKPKSAFTKREHVLPQAFGLFENNFTLIDTVCDECNQYYGNTLELPLARDSYEGMLRFNHGIKQAKEYKGTGKQARLRFRVAEGPLKGAITYREYSSEKNEVVMMLARNQIGFLQGDTQEWLFFLLYEIPTKEELMKLGVDLNSAGSITLLECDIELATERLAMQGISFKVEGDRSGRNESDTGLFQMQGTIDTVIYRAIAKIAFNYFTYLNGSKLALLEEFDAIRRYVRLGELPEYQIVSLVERAILGDEPTEGLRRSGHIVTIEKHKQYPSLLMSQVSINNMFTYLVILNPDANIEVNESGHFFNPHVHSIEPLSRSKDL
ncbi:HNH endonuclease [Paenibacillus mesotrionivorans]|uniref:HNH endonuclease n=1 Tax=Paenibacillus mesotrionivorans TaxID=3160968 RepID=A0ACC7P0E9_9BACL